MQIRISEVPDDTPAGAMRLTLGDAEVERRWALQAHCGSVATILLPFCCIALYRCASQQLRPGHARQVDSPSDSWALLFRHQGSDGLWLSLGHLPRRFAEVERALQSNAGEMAALREMGDSIAEYRSTLDVARCAACWRGLLHSTNGGF